MELMNFDFLILCKNHIEDLLINIFINFPAASISIFKQRAYNGFVIYFSIAPPSTSNNCPLSGFIQKRVSCRAPSKHGGRASALYPSTELRVTPSLDFFYLPII
ncbi:hypothetical protein FHW89_003975 [Mucilaginibacter sp. SG564]|nr:hypothetical protein [Mucilaginibacter sp. SG564]